MSILVSGHFVYAGRVGGAEHMVYNLVEGMDEAGENTTLLCGNKANLSQSFVRRRENSGRSIIECGGERHRFLSEQKACFDPRLRAEAILFPNYYLPPFVPKRLGRTGVVIHDFQYRHFPEHFSPKKRAWLGFSHRQAFNRADKVIVISQFVRDDAIRLYGPRAKKCVVIPNPISWDRFGVIPGEAPFGGRPYILSVAAHYPHKRLDVVIKAFAPLARRRRDLLLVLVGQLARDLVSVGSDVHRLHHLIHDLGLADQVKITGYIDDATLGDLYRHARVFAFPSLFEGFGMPAVEALGFGLRCVTTRHTALPESTLGMADYVDHAESVDEWTQRLDALIDGPRLSPEKVNELRDYYNPLKIGKLYLEALAGR